MVVRQEIRTRQMGFLTPCSYSPHCRARERVAMFLKRGSMKSARTRNGG
jgi:hypothetical protein